MRRVSKEKLATLDLLESLDLGARKVREERKVKLVPLVLLDLQVPKDPLEMMDPRVTLALLVFLETQVHLVSQVLLE